MLTLSCGTQWVLFCIIICYITDRNVHEAYKKLTVHDVIKYMEVVYLNCHSGLKQSFEVYDPRSFINSILMKYKQERPEQDSNPDICNAGAVLTTS